MCSEGEPLHVEVPCNSGYYYSSIIGNGRAIFINNFEEKRNALTKMFVHQAGIAVEFSEKQADSVCVCPRGYSQSALLLAHNLIVATATYQQELGLL